MKFAVLFSLAGCIVYTNVCAMKMTDGLNTNRSACGGSCVFSAQCSEFSGNHDCRCKNFQCVLVPECGGSCILSSQCSEFSGNDDCRCNMWDCVLVSDGTTTNSPTNPPPTSSPPATTPPTTTPPTTTPPTASPPTTTPPTTTPPTTTLPTTTPPTTTAPFPPTEEDNSGENTPTDDTTEFVLEFTEKQCFSSDSYVNVEENAFIKFQVYHIHVNVTSDEISVLIENTEPNLMLIWFSSVNNFSDSYHQSSVINCDWAAEKDIKLKNLEPEKAYTICLINIVDTTVSPLDCISYYHESAKTREVWLYQNSKPLFISLTAAVLVTTIIVGMIIGLWCHQYNQISGGKTNCSNNEVSSQDTINVKVKDLNHKQTYGWGCLKSSISGSESGLTPPLPPHPNWMQIIDEDSVSYEKINYILNDIS